MSTLPPSPLRSNFETPSSVAGKNVTFVNTNQIKPAIAPIAFDYLAPPLKQAGFNLNLLDLCFSDNERESIFGYQHLDSVDYWAVTLRNTDDVYFSSRKSFIEHIRGIVGLLKEAKPVPVIIGGVGFSVMPDRLMDYLNADFGIIAEGEWSLPELLKCLETGRSYHHIPGLVYRSGDEVVVNKIGKGQFVQLDKIGPRFRDTVDNDRYFEAGGQIGIETKRGCDRSCIYCVEPLAKGKSVRFRAAKDVVDEMEKLSERDINVFHINDSEFNLSISHPLELCQEIRSRGLQNDIKWYAYGMPKPFPEKLAKAMREAGCAGMNFGVDSASEKMLKILKRTFSPQDIKDAINVAKKYDLEHVVELLFGAPGETKDTIRETIEFIKEADPERVSVTVGLRIFPGTELEAMVREEGLHEGNPNLSGRISDNDLLIHPIFYLPKELGPNPQEYIDQLIGDDRRFFSANDKLFNYNANDVLVSEIANGARGAYWSILNKAAKRTLNLG